VADLIAAWPILTSVGVGLCVYGGIRADLRSMREQIARNGARIDQHIDWHCSKIER
jgi:hypothetical protein